MVKITYNLSKIREEIDKIDKEIVNLIKERIKLVSKVGEIKADTRERIYVPEREAEIFSTLGKNENLSIETIKPIFTEIISTCRAFEDILSVGILNSKNSLLALKEFLGSQVNYTFFSNLENLFFNWNKFDYILTPISNEMIDLFQNFSLTTVNILTIEKEHFFLLGKYENSNRENITSIFALKNNENRYYLEFISGHYSYPNFNISRIKNQNYIFLGTFPKI
ncbi:Chorismate mutase [Cetobacterium ceti]|uniref:Chorismate mutase n=1 Tax=Cetobacterium ceti TaxID=180163 RepID=A0A1T4KUG1_9FUSO|nr:chorismate mutase [Cetobacterium ceti]SJZ46036.1 Chorismate mutase [Cetobacterium ceti]